MKFQFALQAGFFGCPVKFKAQLVHLGLFGPGLLRYQNQLIAAFLLQINFRVPVAFLLLDCRLFGIGKRFVVFLLGLYPALCQFAVGLHLQAG